MTHDFGTSTRPARPRGRRSRSHRATFGLAVVGVLAAACGDQDPGAVAPADGTVIQVAAVPGAPAYTGTLLVLPSGFSAAAALSVNTRGTVAGWARETGGMPQAVVWEDGEMIRLPGLGGSTSGAEAINSRGDVAGYAETTAGDMHAVLWRNGEPIDLGTLGGRTSFARGINAHGDVVGTSETATGAFNAFLWSKGRMIDLGGLPNATISWAEDINDRGDIVGWSNVPVQTATLWQRGRVIPLGTLAFESAALAINARGQIVGASIPVFQHSARAVLWAGGEIVDMGGPTGQFSSASGINNRGQIVGAAELPGCFQCPVLWHRDVMIPLAASGSAAPGAANAISHGGLIVGFMDGFMPAMWTEGSGSAKVQTVAASAGRSARATVGHGTPTAAPAHWSDRFCGIQGRIRDSHSALAAAAGC